MGKVNSFLLCKQEEDIEVVEERAYVNCCVSCKDTQN